jgi:hypothetical protein
MNFKMQTYLWHTLKNPENGLYLMYLFTFTFAFGNTYYYYIIIKLPYILYRIHCRVRLSHASLIETMLNTKDMHSQIFYDIKK